MSKYAYEYNPYENRTADEQYKEMIRTILEKGYETESPMLIKVVMKLILLITWGGPRDLIF